MNWIKIRDRRINLSLIDLYKPYCNYEDSEYCLILWNGNSIIEIDFYTKEELDEAITRLDELLEKGLHTLKEFK